MKTASGSVSTSLFSLVSSRQSKTLIIENGVEWISFVYF